MRLDIECENRKVVEWIDTLQATLLILTRAIDASIMTMLLCYHFSQ
jgi:hypothetical protein